MIVSTVSDSLQYRGRRVSGHAKSTLSARTNAGSVAVLLQHGMLTCCSTFALYRTTASSATSAYSGRDDSGIVADVLTRPFARTCYCRRLAHSNSTYYRGDVTAIATSSENPDMILTASRDKTIIMWTLTRDDVRRRASSGMWCCVGCVEARDAGMGCNEAQGSGRRS